MAQMTRRTQGREVGRVIVGWNLVEVGDRQNKSTRRSADRGYRSFINPVKLLRKVPFNAKQKITQAFASAAAGAIAPGAAPASGHLQSQGQFRPVVRVAITNNGHSTKNEKILRGD